MVSLVQVSESAQGLVLGYPLWTVFALAVATAAIAAFAVLRGRRLKRRWPFTLAVLFAAWSCVYVATYRMNLGDESGSAYAFMRFDHAVRWQDAADVYLEQRGGGSHLQIVVLDRARRAFAFDVAELSAGDRDRVMTYIVDRVPESAFPRAPELLRRQAGPGVRPAGFFPDQQI